MPTQQAIAEELVGRLSRIAVSMFTVQDHAGGFLFTFGNWQVVIDGEIKVMLVSSEPGEKLRVICLDPECSSSDCPPMSTQFRLEAQRFATALAKRS